MHAALIPREDQAIAIARMVAEPTQAALNGSTMGTGKTLMAVEVAKQLRAQVILIIAPLGTRLGWKKTFAQQGVDLPYQWINSTVSGKEALANWEWQQPGIYFIGTELFVRKGWESGARTKTWGHTADLVLFDEAHRGQNRKSKTHKTLMQVTAKYKLAMSGTPTGNSFEGAWAVARWLWKPLIPASFHNWSEKWCKFQYDHFAPGGRKIVGELNPGEFFNSLPCYVRLESDLNVSLTEDIRYVELTAPQRKAYEDLQRDMVTWVQNNPLVVEFPITLRARLRQASLGMFDVDDEGAVTFDVECKSSKMDAALDILHNEWDDEPTLIFTDSQKFADVIVHRLTAKGFETRAWHGKVSGVKREEAKAQFIAGEVKYIVAVISALAEGVDEMQFATRNMLWVSRSDSRIINEQAMKRVYRHGQTQAVRSTEIVALDTLDDGVLSSQILKAIEMNKVLKEKR